MADNPALDSYLPEMAAGEGPSRPTPIRAARFNALPGAGSQAPAEPASIQMLMDVPLRVAVELGRTKMLVRQVLELRAGSVVELDRIAGDSVDVLINDRLMARGEVVVVDDKFGIRITEIIPQRMVGEE
jgi:flagellar motor switch protein FliN/FliY